LHGIRVLKAYKDEITYSSVTSAHTNLLSISSPFSFPSLPSTLVSPFRSYYAWPLTYQFYPPPAKFISPTLSVSWKKLLIKGSSSHWLMRSPGFGHPFLTTHTSSSLLSLNFHQNTRFDTPFNLAYHS